MSVDVCFSMLLSDPYIRKLFLGLVRTVPALHLFLRHCENSCVRPGRLFLLII